MKNSMKQRQETMLKIDGQTFALCIMTLGSTLMQTVFMFYYVRVFLGRFHIDTYWFQLTQILFMIWNTLNDPLFGYMQDVVGYSWMRNRKRSILYMSPFFVISFCIFWFPWSNVDSPAWITGVHLIIALFFYDGFFSFVMLAWSALFTEATVDHTNRVRAIKYVQIATLVGVNIIPIIEKCSHSLENFGIFQALTVLVACIAFVCLVYTGVYAPERIITTSSSFVPLIEQKYQKLPSLAPSSQLIECVQLGRQVMMAHDFRAITLTNFLHTFRSVAHLNFAAISTEMLISADVLPQGSWSLSAFFGCCTLIPQILIITNSGLVLRYGPHRLMIVSFIVSIVTGIWAFVFAGFNVYALMMFMLIDSITVHSFSPLFNILFADFVDDDMMRHNRSNRISSLIFSLNALIVKPAQSLAPMVIVWLLNRHNYSDYQHDKESGLRSTNDADKYMDLRSMMFTLVCLIPVVLATLQFVIFRHYSLGNRHKSKMSIVIE